MLTPASVTQSSIALTSADLPSANYDETPISAGPAEQLAIRPPTRLVPIVDIKIDGGTQTRATIDASTVEEYAEAMAAAAQFPAIILYTDGVNHWLADGFHRCKAAQKLGREEILAEVKTGTRLDALRYALGANVTNGLRRSNADKRRCVEIALETFPDHADRLLAEMCDVSHTFVSNCRGQLATVASCFSGTTVHAPAQTTGSRVGKDGKTRKSSQVKTMTNTTASVASPERADPVVTSMPNASDQHDVPSTEETRPAFIQPTNPDELYGLADGRQARLPSVGCLTTGELRAALGKLKPIAKQWGGGTMNTALLTKLEEGFLKITEAVYEKFELYGDPAEKEAIVGVLHSVGHAFEMAK